MKKTCKTIFPLGMGIQKVEGSVVILNFLDTFDDNPEDIEIIASIAMPKGKAKQLIKLLDEALNEEQDTDDDADSDS